MGVDWIALRRKYQEAKQEQATRGAVTYLESGPNDVRLLPDPKKDSLPYASGGKHYHLDKIGAPNKVEWCPKLTKGLDCPLCDAVFEGYNMADSEQEREFYKTLMPGSSFLFPVIVRKIQDAGPKLLEVGMTVWGQIMDIFDPDNPDPEERVDLTDPTKRGYDIRITKTPKSEHGSTFTTKRKVKRSALGTREQVTEWLKNYPDPQAYIDSQLKTAEQLEALLVKSTDEEEAIDDDEGVPYDDDAFDDDESDETEAADDDDESDETEMPVTDEDLDDLDDDDFEVVNGKIVKKGETKEKAKPKKEAKPKPEAKPQETKPEKPKTGSKRPSAADVAAEIKKRMAARASK